MENSKSLHIDQYGNDLTTTEGTQAAMAIWEIHRARKFTPVQPGSTKYYINSGSDEDVFNVKPFLKSIGYHDKEEVIQAFYRIMADVTQYYLQEEGTGRYFDLTIMRSVFEGLTAGYGIFNLNENLEDKEN